MRDGSEPPQPGIAASSNAPGLLWAYAGSAGVAPVQLSVAEIPGALAERDWVWVNVDLIDRRVHGWVGSLFGEQSTRALLAEPDAALSVEPEDGEIHGICADFNMDFLRVSDSIGRFGFSASQRLVVTGWRHPLSSLDAVRNAIRGGTTFACGFDVLAAIVAAFCRSVDARLRAAEIELDKVEDQLLAAHTRDERLALKEVRRLALALHRPVGAMVTLLGDAAAEDPALPLAGAAAIEQMAARLRAVDQIVLQLNDRAKLLQEEMAAELAGESNRSLRALTVMTAMLLPGTLVVGFFGMNTAGLPFVLSPWGSLAAIVIGAVATYVFYRIMVRAGASLKF